MFFIGEYIHFFHQDFYGLKPLFNSTQGFLYIPTVAGLMYKNAINFIELKQGVLRIVDYDVEEKTNKNK